MTTQKHPIGSYPTFALQKQMCGPDDGSPMAMRVRWKVVDIDTERELADLGPWLDDMGFERKMTLTHARAAVAKARGAQS